MQLYNSLLLNSISEEGQTGNIHLPLFIIFTEGPDHIINFYSEDPEAKGLSLTGYFPTFTSMMTLLDKGFETSEKSQLSINDEITIGSVKYAGLFLTIEPRKNKDDLVSGMAIYAFDSPPFKVKEEMFFQLAESLPQLVWMADPMGTVFYYNGRVADYAGAKKRNDGSWYWEGLLHEEDMGPTSQVWQNAILTGKAYEKEHRVQMADGTYQWHLSRAYPQKNHAGEITSWYGTATNIHEQKQFEETIAEKEERLRIAIEAAELGTWDIDLITGSVIASEKLNQLLGLPGNNQTSFEDFLKLVHPDDEKIVFEKSRDVVLIENRIREFDLQFRIIRADDKEVRWMKARGKVYENKNGEYARFAGTMIDITKEKNAEKELRFKKALLEAQNEATPDGILIVDGHGSILSSNKQFAEVWLMPAEIVLTGDANAALNFAKSQVIDAESFMKRVSYSSSTRTEAGKEEIYLKDGRILERYGKAVIGEDQFLYGWAWHFRDITEQKRTQQEIIIQKVLYQNILEGISDAFISYDFSWKLIYANEKAIDLSAKPVNQLLGKKLWELYPEMVNTESFRIFQKVMTLREPAQFEYYSRFTDSWFETKVYPTIEGIAIFGININERKKAEEALNYQKKLLETVTENTSMGLFLLNEEGYCIYMNEAAENLTGYSFSDLQGKIIKDFIPFDIIKEEESFTQESDQREVFNRKPRKGEIIFYQKNGTPQEGAFTSSPILLDEQHLGTVLEVRNITEEKKAQTALKDSEEHFRQLADLVPQIIFTARPDGHLDYYNKRWFDFTGYAESYGDQSWIPILHPDDIQPTLDCWYNSVKTGEPYQIEYRFFNADDGQYRWFLGKAVPIKNKKGEIIKWFGTCTDIDDQKRFSEKLEDIVKERTEALERSNEDLQQFAHVASHDLKEPLRKIRTFNSRVLEEFRSEIPDKAKTYLEKVSVAANRMNRIIEGVLEYSTLDAIHQTFEIINLNDIIKNIEEDLEVVIQAKNARLEYGEMPEMEGSAILIHQLLYNLINNALKFSKADVPNVIKISSTIKKYRDGEGGNSAKLSNDLLEISISDNGIGFNQEFAHRIFDTFSRLNSKDKFEGTGLGLALCRKIVHRHKGQIQAKGTEGEGAVFTITLPRYHSGLNPESPGTESFR